MEQLIQLTLVVTLRANHRELVEKIVLCRKEGQEVDGLIAQRIRSANSIRRTTISLSRERMTEKRSNYFKKRLSDPATIEETSHEAPQVLDRYAHLVTLLESPSADFGRLWPAIASELDACLLYDNTKRRRGRKELRSANHDEEEDEEEEDEEEEDEEEEDEEEEANPERIVAQMEEEELDQAIGQEEQMFYTESTREERLGSLVDA